VSGAGAGGLLGDGVGFLAGFEGSFEVDDRAEEHDDDQGDDDGEDADAALVRCPVPCASWSHEPAAGSESANPRVVAR
jgi:hypothetical protein